MDKKLMTLLAGLVFALSASSVHADLIVSWSLDDPARVAGPNDILTIDSTIANDNSSDQDINLDVAIEGAAFADGDFSPSYDFQFGPSGGASFLSQFNGIVLTPGDSFSFVYGILTPTVEFALGTYVSSFMGIDIGGVGTDVQPTNGPFQVTAVPVPAAGWLFGSGLIGLLGVARRKAA